MIILSGAADGRIENLQDRCQRGAEGFRARLQVQEFTGIRLLVTLEELEVAEAAGAGSLVGDVANRVPVGERGRT